VKFPKDWYFQNEVLIKRKMASAVFDHSLIGLKGHLFESKAAMVGLEDKEALGGMIYLTNYRLLYRSHILNRERGTFSIFLPSIRNISDTSFGPNRNITIETDVLDLNFIVWGIPNFIKLIQETMQAKKTIKYDNSLRKALRDERLDLSSSVFLTTVNEALTDDAREKVIQSP